MKHRLENALHTSGGAMPTGPATFIVDESPEAIALAMLRVSFQQKSEIARARGLAYALTAMMDAIGIDAFVAALRASEEMVTARERVP